MACMNTEQDSIFSANFEFRDHLLDDLLDFPHDPTNVCDYPNSKDVLDKDLWVNSHEKTSKTAHQNYPSLNYEALANGSTHISYQQCSSDLGLEEYNQRPVLLNFENLEMDPHALSSNMMDFLDFLDDSQILTPSASGEINPPSGCQYSSVSYDKESSFNMYENRGHSQVCNYNDYNSKKSEDCIHQLFQNPQTDSQLNNSFENVFLSTPHQQWYEGCQEAYEDLSCLLQPDLENGSSRDLFDVAELLVSSGQEPDTASDTPIELSTIADVCHEKSKVGSDSFTLASYCQNTSSIDGNSSSGAGFHPNSSKTVFETSGYVQNKDENVLESSSVAGISPIVSYCIAIDPIVRKGAEYFQGTVEMNSEVLAASCQDMSKMPLELLHGFSNKKRKMAAKSLTGFFQDQSYVNSELLANFCHQFKSEMASGSLPSISQSNSEMVSKWLASYRQGKSGIVSGSLPLNIQGKSDNAAGSLSSTCQNKPEIASELLSGFHQGRADMISDSAGVVDQVKSKPVTSHYQKCDIAPVSTGKNHPDSSKIISKSELGLGGSQDTLTLDVSNEAEPVSKPDLTKEWETQAEDKSTCGSSDRFLATKVLAKPQNLSTLQEVSNDIKLYSSTVNNCAFLVYPRDATKLEPEKVVKKIIELKVGKKDHYINLPVRKVNKLTVREMLTQSATCEERSMKEYTREYRSNFNMVIRQKHKRLNVS